MSEYTKLLKSPKWQKKRLEIMQRDDFKCVWCGSEDTQLHVHHLYYEKYRKPWEYEDEAYVTICDLCHENEHATLYRSGVDLVDVLKEEFFMSSYDIGKFSDVLKVLSRKVGGTKEALFNIQDLVNNVYKIQLIAERYNQPEYDHLKAVESLMKKILGIKNDGNSQAVENYPVNIPQTECKE
jgi:hypothetical protein